MAGKRTETAVEVLRAGGFFRTQLERAWGGGEKFKTRLRTAEGLVVPGVGAATLRELEGAGKLVRRECVVTSAWPVEFGWKEGA